MIFTPQKTTIAHIDCNYFFRQGLQLSLDQSEYYELKLSVSNFDEFLEGVGSKKIDIILLGDLEVDRLSMTKTLRNLLNAFPESAIIAFQSTTNFKHISRLIKIGVKGFFSKKLKSDEFYKSLLELRQNGFSFRKETLKDLIELAQHEHNINDLDIVLSGIEKQVLVYVSNGYTAEEISHKLNKSKKTIEGYRYRMIKKTEVRNLTELVTWGFRNKILS